MPAEASERPTILEERTNKGKGKVAEEEVDDFVSEEAHSNMRKYYANKGFVAERRFKTPITPFKELIEKRGWGTLCAHRRAGYAAVVREFYSNLVCRKNNTVYIRGDLGSLGFTLFFFSFLFFSFLSFSVVFF